jgi:hypothetical protein
LFEMIGARSHLVLSHGVVSRLVGYIGVLAFAPILTSSVTGSIAMDYSHLPFTEFFFHVADAYFNDLV